MQGGSIASRVAPQRQAGGPDRIIVRPHHGHDSARVHRGPGVPSGPEALDRSPALVRQVRLRAYVTVRPPEHEPAARGPIEEHLRCAVSADAETMPGAPAGFRRVERAPGLVRRGGTLRHTARAWPVGATASRTPPAPRPASRPRVSSVQPESGSRRAAITPSSVPHAANAPPDASKPDHPVSPPAWLAQTRPLERPTTTANRVSSSATASATSSRVPGTTSAAPQPVSGTNRLARRPSLKVRPRPPRTSWLNTATASPLGDTASSGL